MPMTKQPYQYKLVSITMNNGTVLRPNTLMVLIGPNNAGKSRVLKEIARQATMLEPPHGVVVSTIEVDYPSTLDDLREAYEVERHQDERGNWVFRALNEELTKETSSHESNSWPSDYERAFQNRSPNSRGLFAARFGMAMVASLTTESRLGLVREGDSPSDYLQTNSLLQMLYNSGRQAALEMSGLTKRTFGKEIALDFTVPHRLLLRVGDDFSELPPDPRDARPLMQEYERLDQQGDGIRSFVGISVALLIVKRGLFLIDEPEAFLHPPQAFRIGAFIADQVNRSRQTIIATHSTDVLRGILSRTQEVDIVRIDRTGNNNTFSQLDPKRLGEIVNDPLLTSARVLDGLFYSGTVVVEADSDARFYHSASAKRAPETDLYFVKADNKQTVSRIVRLYRDLRVRSAGITDFDVLNDRTELKKVLEEFGFPPDAVERILHLQGTISESAKELPPGERLARVRRAMEELGRKIDEVTAQSVSLADDGRGAKDLLLRNLEGRFRQLADSTRVWKEFKQRGRVALAGDAEKVFDTIWSECASYGFFINPAGELESILSEYGIEWTSDKKSWITKALQLIPSLEPDDSKYPWKLLAAIHRYLLPKTDEQTGQAQSPTSSAV